MRQDISLLQNYYVKTVVIVLFKGKKISGSVSYKGNSTKVTCLLSI